MNFSSFFFNWKSEFLIHCKLKEMLTSDHLQCTFISSLLFEENESLKQSILGRRRWPLCAQVPLTPSPTPTKMFLIVFNWFAVLLPPWSLCQGPCLCIYNFKSYVIYATYIFLNYRFHYTCTIQHWDKSSALFSDFSCFMCAFIHSNVSSLLIRYLLVYAVFICQRICFIAVLRLR